MPAHLRRYRVIGWAIGHDWTSLYYASVLAAGSTIALIGLITFSRREVQSALAPPIALAFCIPAFGMLYYREYLRDRSSFQFSAGPIERQLPLVEEMSQARVEHLDHILRILRGAIEQIDTAQSVEVVTVGRSGFFCSATEEYRLILPSLGRTVSYITPQSRIGTNVSVTIFDQNAENIAHFLFGSRSVGMENISEIHGELLVTQMKRIEVERARLDTLASPHPDCWGFFTFFYFSVVTQSTVGYGDITPNSPQVRLLAIMQLLLGYLIVGTFFSLLFMQKR